MMSYINFINRRTISLKKNTILHILCRDNDIMFDSFINSNLFNKDLFNKQDINGNTCLQVAILHNNINIVRKLINHIYCDKDFLSKKNVLGENAVQTCINIKSLYILKMIFNSKYMCKELLLMKNNYRNNSLQICKNSVMLKYIIDSPFYTDELFNCYDIFRNNILINFAKNNQYLFNVLIDSIELDKKILFHQNYNRCTFIHYIFRYHPKQITNIFNKPFFNNKLLSITDTDNNTPFMYIINFDEFNPLLLIHDTCLIKNNYGQNIIDKLNNHKIFYDRNKIIKSANIIYNIMTKFYYFNILTKYIK